MAGRTAALARRFARTPDFMPAWIFLATMLVFAAGRLALYLAYLDDFRGLGAGRVLLAFVRGARFDASIALTVTGIPLLLMGLPFRACLTRWWRLPLSWFCFVALVVFAFVIGGDIVYFDEVHRHAGPETVVVGKDIDILLQYVTGKYLPLVLLVAGALLGLGWVWHRLTALRPSPFRRRAVASGVEVGLLVAIVVAVRGGVTQKPVNIVNAFEGVNVQEGYLALNGPFAIYHSVRSARAVKSSFMPEEEATRVVRSLLSSGRDRFLDPAYPLMRASTPPRSGATHAPPLPGGSRPRNVVIVLLESWEGPVVDEIARARGLPPLGVTPEFARLAASGALFTRFYANGQRSTHGIAAVIAGMHTLEGTPYIGLGMEQNRMKYLGEIAKENGCATYFMQASPRRSFRCDAISSVAGFDNYFGMEDCPQTGHIPHPHSLGAWDYDLLMFASDVFARAPKPFLGFVFTLTTHGPFEMTDPRWVKRPPDCVLNKYLNCISYADWALARFVERARASGWFEDTVFVFVADHTCGRFVRADDRLSFVSIPLLIVAPGLEPGVRTTLSSQADLIPTIMDLAGWSGTHSTFGRSLVEDPGPPRFVLASVGGMELWIEDCGWICHNRHSILERRQGPGGPADFALMEHRCKAAVQTVSHVLSRNRVFRPAEP